MDLAVGTRFAMVDAVGRNERSNKNVFRWAVSGLGSNDHGRPAVRMLGALDGSHTAVFAFFRVDALAADSANISSGFSFRIFSPGIGTGYSPSRHPRQMSSRECFRAAMSPFIDR